jgi:hypothetical protein
MTSLWASLHTSDPGEILQSEASYPGYSRVELPLDKATWKIIRSIEILPLSRFLRKKPIQLVSKADFFPQTSGSSVQGITHAALRTEDGRTVGVPAELFKVLYTGEFITLSIKFVIHEDTEGFNDLVAEIERSMQGE